MSTTTTKKEITPGEYLQLIGLLTLAERHMQQLADIEAAAAELLGVIAEPSGYTGHVGDMIFSTQPPNAAQLLKQLGITVRSTTDDLPA